MELALDSQDPETARLAARILAGDTDPELVKQLVAAGPKAVNAILNGLSGPGTLEGCDALEGVLADIGPQAVEPISAVIDARGPDFEGAMSAGWALGQIGDPRGVPALIRLLASRGKFTRWSAATALGYIGDKEAVGPLEKRLRDRSPSVRGAVAKALEAIGMRTIS